MKKGLIFTALACTMLLGVTACQSGGGGSTPPVVTYDVTITNKAALEGEWKVGDTKPVNIRIPGVTVTQALLDGDLVISSSDSTVVSINGDQALAVAAGEATITATYLEKYSDTADVTISKADVYKMATSLDPSKEYILAHKAGDGSGALYSVSQEVSSTFYIGWETNLSNAPVAKVVEEDVAGDYKYSIKLTKTSAEGEETTKTVGVVTTAKEKYAAGFAGETVKSGDTTFTLEKALFKLDDQYRLVTSVKNDIAETASSVELVLGASGTYNTTGYGPAEKIVNPTRLYSLVSEEVHATSMTVDPESIEVIPGGKKQIKVTLDPVDTTDEVSFKSNNTDVAKVDVAGNVTGVAVGETTVTVTAGSLTKNVSVKVAGEAIKYGTKDSPLSVDEVVAELAKIGKNIISAEPFYVRGLVHSVQEAYGNEGHKNVTFWLKNEAGAKAFEIFRAVLDESDAELFANVKALKAGDDITCYGYGELYNTTYELTTNSATGANPASPTILALTPGQAQDYPEPDLITGKTIAEFLADSKSGDASKLYELTGEITGFKNGATTADKYGNVTIKDDSGSIYLYGTSATATALTWDRTAGVYSFSNPQDFLTNETTKDAKVGDTLTVKVYRLDDFKEAPQATGLVTKLEPGEGGGGSEIPEPDLITGKSITEFVAATDSKGDATKLYELTGEVTAWNSGTDGGKYGNFKFSDGTTEIVIYGSTATATALAWNATAGVYTFSNPQDFLTNELTKTIVIGSTVTVKVFRIANFNTTIEANGLVTNVQAPVIPDLEDFTVPETLTVRIGETKSVELSPVPEKASLDGVDYELAVKDGTADVVKIENNAIVGVAAGEKVVTVTAIGKTHEITVTVPSGGQVTEHTVTIKASDFTAVESSKVSATVQGVTFEISTGTITSDQIRVFKNQTLKISVADGTVTKIVLTCTASGADKYGPGCFGTVDPTGYTVSDKVGTWEGSAELVTFTATANQVRVTQLVITYLA